MGHGVHPRLVVLRLMHFGVFPKIVYRAIFPNRPVQQVAGPRGAGAVHANEDVARNFENFELRPGRMRSATGVREVGVMVLV